MTGAVFIFAEPPGPPGSLKVVDSTTSSVTLGWAKPVYDGGAPIIGYMVEMRLKGESEEPEEGWTKCKTAGPLVLTEFTIQKLDEKLEYEFRVSAQNQVGMGRPAQLKDAVVPKEMLGNVFYIFLNRNKLIPQFPHSYTSDLVFLYLQRPLR